MSATKSESSASNRYLRPGQKIGRYRLLALVASGGMAQIWAAKPETGGFSRTVVLKVVRPEYAEDAEYRRMLIDEAAAASAVHHPNVCEIFELGQHEGVVFIAMEWVPGDSIAGLIRQRTQYVPFSYALAARVIADACAGLHAAHLAVGADGECMNIVHRDISPQNILLSCQGHVKVTDFGIAKARDQIHSNTRAGEVKGKFAYIAPEQILGQVVDHRSDIYAMGCVLFVATLGLRPFGRGTHAVMSKIVKGDFKPPRKLVPTYPRGLEQIAVKALSREPDQRYASAEEMRLALEDWLAHSGKIITHSDISRAVNERLSPLLQKQIQTLRSANRFTARELSSRVSDCVELSSLEVPTAASGLIQVPNAFDPVASLPPPASAAHLPIDSHATQRSIGVDDPRRERCRGDIDSSATIASDSLRERPTIGSPARSRRAQSSLDGSLRTTQSAGAPPGLGPPPAPSNHCREPSLPPTGGRGDDPRRTVLLAAVVLILMGLAFLAGRL